MPQRAQDAAACPGAAASDIEARSAAAASNCVSQSAEAAAALGMTECSDTMQQLKEDLAAQANITACADGWINTRPIGSGSVIRAVASKGYVAPQTPTCSLETGI